MIDLTLSSTLTALRPTSYFSLLSVKYYLIDTIQWEFDESVIDHSASSIPQCLYRLEYLYNNRFPDGDFEHNQLLDISMGLSPLYIHYTNDLHVSTGSFFHYDFSQLRNEDE